MIKFFGGLTLLIIGVPFLCVCNEKIAKKGLDMLDDSLK